MKRFISLLVIITLITYLLTPINLYAEAGLSSIATNTATETQTPTPVPTATETQTPTPTPTSSQQPNNPDTLNDGLVAYYEFEDNAKDSTRNENNGNVNGEIHYVDGMKGKAAYFNGTNSYIEVPNGVPNGLNFKDQFTFSFYVQAEKPNTCLIQKGESCPDGDRNYKGTAYTISLDSRHNGAYNVIDPKSGYFINSVAVAPNGNYNSNRFVSSSDEPIKDSVSQYVTVMFKNKTFNYYINGQKVNNNNVYEGGAISPDDFTQIHSTEATFKIGVSETWQNYNHAYVNYFKGLIDDLRIYNRALSDEEIQKLYKNVSGSSEADTRAPVAPANVAIASMTGKTATISWDASSDNVGVTGYEIFRDGVYKGTTDKTTFTDNDLNPGTTYSYTVSAYDAAGNKSSQSSPPLSVIPQQPRISSVGPDNGTTIGGAGNKTLTAYFADNKNSQGSKATFEYSADGTTWTTVPGSISGPFTNGTNNYFTCSWDVTSIPSGSYMVRYTVIDASGCSDTVTATYQLDRTAPAVPEDFTATQGAKCINLTWSISPEADASGYKIYRAENENGPFNVIASISGKANASYSDNSVNVGQVYYYRVTALDKFDQESVPSGDVNAIPTLDTTKPEILGIEPLDGTVGQHAQIIVKGWDDLSLSNIKLQYSTDSTNWTDIGTINTANNATFIWDTPSLSGAVKVRAIATDSSGNVSDITERNYTVDNMGPAKVTNLSAEPSLSATSVTLKWSDVKDQDFSYFSVEQKNSQNEEYRTIGTVNNVLGMNVSGLSPETTYWFRVAAYDTHGNKGTYSDEVTTTTTHDSTSPVITSLQPKSERYSTSIPFNVISNDNVGVASVTIQSSTDSTNWTDLAVINTDPSSRQANVSYKVDVSCATEGAYYLRAISKDKEGNISDTSGKAPYVQYMIDHTGPGKPSGLAATSEAGDIRLSWAKGEDDIASYRVYRSSSETGTYTPIANGLTMLGYIDDSMTDNAVYYYKVSAVDQAGNEGKISDVVSGSLLDDTKVPEIISVYPTEGTTLPANPVISVLASDDRRLSNVSVEYQVYGSGDDKWLSLGSKDVNERNGVETFSWNTSGLSDGDYKIRVWAKDASGKTSEIKESEYKLNLNPPAAPSLTVEPGGWKVDLSWASGNESDLSGFRVYRSTVQGKDYKLLKEIAKTETSCSDSPLSPGQNYYYKVQAVDIYGNSSMSEEKVASPYKADPYPPKAEAGVDQSAIVDMEVAFDGTGSSDNDSISSYLWDFGDGSTSNIAQPVHTYSTPNTYTVTLTVTDPAGHSDTDKATVVVYPKDQAGTIKITIRDGSTGDILPGASVYVDLPDDPQKNFTPKKCTADENGIVTIMERPGNYNVSAYKDKYLPKEVNVKIEQYKTTTAKISLPRGAVVVGSLQVHRMALDEIKAANIDVNASGNQFVYKFETHLEFNEVPLPVHYVYINGNGVRVGDYTPIYIGGGPGGSSGGSSSGGTTGGSTVPLTVYPKPIPHEGHPEVAPSMAYLVIPQQVSWLKEFFEVNLIVKNMAGEGFDIENSSATLNLPEGLSLAPTKVAQSSAIDLGTIAGGESKEAKWFIRGDTTGDYENLSASFKGTLMPFGDMVNAEFKATEPIKVYGGKALHIYVNAESMAYIGEPYYVHFALVNESPIPVYNVKTSFGAFEQPEQKTEIVLIHPDGQKEIINPGSGGGGIVLTAVSASSGKTGSDSSSGSGNNTQNSNKYTPVVWPGDTLNVERLNPGDSIVGTFVGSVLSGGNPDQVCDALTKAFVTTQDGSNTEIPVTINTIPSHMNKYRVVMVGGDSFWADPVDTNTGAHVIEKSALSVHGATELSYNISYSSTVNDQAQKVKDAITQSKTNDLKSLGQSDMGTGWSHNYSTKLEENPDGSIAVYWSPYSYTLFNGINERTNSDGQRVLYGTKDANGNIILSGSVPSGEIEYFTIQQGMKDYVLKRNADNTYILTCGYKCKYYFDSNGNLTKYEDKNGRIVTIQKVDSTKLVITDPVSGQTLTVNYNAQGLVESVSDKLGRMTKFEYDGNNLVKITDPVKKSTQYTYDDKGHVLTGTDGEGVKYFTNTYDDKGRVLTQDDAVDGNGLTRFSYDEETERWHTITNITDRNGNTRKTVHDRFGQLIRTEDQLRNKTIHTYDPDGNQASTTDPNNNTMEFTYDDHGNLLTAKDATGVKSTMTYDERGNLLTTEDAYKNKTINTYDDKNYLLSTKDPLGNVISYKYDGNGQLVSKSISDYGTETAEYENGLRKTLTDPAGKKKQFEYDAAGRMTKSKDRDGNSTGIEYDNNGNPLTMIDQLGNKTSYTYDSNGNVLTKTDAKNNITNYTYNGNGKLTCVEDPLHHKTQYEYDGEDRLVKTIDDTGKYSTITYDAAGRVSEEKDAYGRTTEYTYDNNGQLLTETIPGKGTVKYTYYKNGKVNTYTDASNNVTTYFYDDDGRLVREMNAAGKNTTYDYDAAGNMICVTDPLLHKKQYTYDSQHVKLTEKDANGNVTTFKYNANGKLISVTDALNNTTRYEYSDEGRLVKTTDARGNASTIIYDAKGRAVALTNALGKTVKFEYDAMDRVVGGTDAYERKVSTVTYDAMGNVLTTTDALNNVKTNHYDSLYRLIETIDELNRSTKYSYDSDGKFVSVTDPINGVAKQNFDDNGRLSSIVDPNNNETKYGYDAAGRLISETTAIGSSKNYTYNSLNLLDTVKNGRGQITAYHYDDAGRLISLDEVGGTVSYTYDNNGNVLTVTDNKGMITREYDKLNRVTKYTDVNGNTVQYAYDEVGNLITLTYPGGKIVRYKYNVLNMMESVEDWAGRITKYEYDDNAQLVKTTRPNGSILTMEYNAAGRLVHQKDVDKNGGIINEYKFTLDAAGNVSTEEMSNEPLPSSIKNVVMTYDKSNRLATYNGNAIQYDADGNMTYGPLSGIMSSFGYDSRNRLVSAGSTSYIYDAENQRISQIENGSKTDYVINTQAQLSQLLIKTGPDGKKTYYIYGMGLIGQEDEAGNYKTYHFDSRGSTTAITDINGSVTDRIGYAPYGEIISRTGTTDTPFLYNGRDGVMTDKNGLYYMRARYYNPEIKRFINQDVVIGSINEGQTLNRYSYVNGNPVSYVDPFGLSRSGATNIFKGIMNMLNGSMLAWGGAIACAAAIEVLTCGTATPLLMAAAGVVLTASAATVVMGAADAYEGYQEVGYGIEGSNKLGFNFVRDTVFGGNEDLYRKVEFGTSMVSAVGSIGVSIAGSAARAGARVAVNEIENTTEEIVGSEAEEIVGAESGELKLLPEGKPSRRELALQKLERAAAGEGSGPVIELREPVYAKGYRPQPGERTLQGFVENNVSTQAEEGLYTKSPGFNNNSQTGVGGQFKRFGTDYHGGLKPHVHQPVRNVNLKTGEVFGRQGKTVGKDVFSPSEKDVKQLYDYLFNSKYLP